MSVLVQEDVRIFIKKGGNFENIAPKVELKNNLKAPIEKGDIVGKVTYTNGNINYEYDLIAGSDVSYNYFLIGIIAIGSLLAIILFIRIIIK